MTRYTESKKARAGQPREPWLCPHCHNTHPDGLLVCKEIEDAMDAAWKSALDIEWPNNIV